MSCCHSNHSCLREKWHKTVITCKQNKLLKRIKSQINDSSSHEDVISRSDLLPFWGGEWAKCDKLIASMSIFMESFCFMLAQYALLQLLM